MFAQRHIRQCTEWAALCSALLKFCYCLCSVLQHEKCQEMPAFFVSKCSKLSLFNVQSQETCWVIFLAKCGLTLFNKMLDSRQWSMCTWPGESVGCFAFFMTECGGMSARVFVIISLQETDQHIFSLCNTSSAYTLAGFRQSSRPWSPSGRVIFQVI